MPLQLKCKSCGRLLLLEEVFQGAHCRCQYCSTLVPVPRLPSSAVRRPATRPDRPIAANLIPASGAAPVRRVSTSPARTVLSRLKGFRTGATMVVLGTFFLGVTVWTVTGSVGGQAGFGLTVSRPDLSEAVVSAGSEVDVLAADPRSAYFGIAVTGPIVGFVVDSDETMVSYIDAVAYVTHAVNADSEQSGRQFGILQAVSDPEGREVLEVFAPSTDLIGATTILQSRLAGGATDLPKTMAVTEGWNADQLFVVLSKPLAAAEIDLLQQRALQSGATTHVIALGQAARQDLSAISAPTGGAFVPISDEVLGSLVERCRSRMPEDDHFSS
ncbi:MAG: hypothetical protein ACE5E1_06775 [Phycisphaerae bacterium]